MPFEPSKSAEPECIPDGFAAVEKEVNQIKSHKIQFVIFDFGNINPVEMRVVASGGIDNSANLRITPNNDELHSVFNSCSSKLEKGKPYFVVYDFGYYNTQNSYRSMIVLVSLIPDDLGFRDKIAFASNINMLQVRLGVALRIEALELCDFTYDKLLEVCSSIQRK